MSGCVFSVLLQKVKFKTQNDLIDHQSASQSGYEDVRIGFKQSKQSFNALKCRKCAIKIKIKNARSRAIRTNLVFVRSIVFKPLDRFFQVSSQVFKSKGPLDRFFQVSSRQSAILSVNEDVRISNVGRNCSANSATTTALFLCSVF